MNPQLSTSPPARFSLFEGVLVLFALLILPLAACQGPAASAPSSSSAGGVPGWMPVYPGSEVQPLLENPTEEGVAGVLSVVTEAGARDVVAFYRDELEKRGFKVRIAPFETPHGRGARISGHSASETEGINLTVTPEEGSTTVLVNYEYAPGS